MLYAIVANDIPRSSGLRQQFSTEHRARIHELQKQGRLVLAGPCPNEDQDLSGASGFSGSLIVAEFSSLEQAQQWANKDPFLINGVYQTVVVKPFKQFLP